LNESEFWLPVGGPDLEQGDLLPNCLVPVFAPEDLEGEEATVPLQSADLIVATQSCDLEQHNAPFVVFARILTMQEFEEANRDMKGKQWNQVVKRRFEYLLMLRNPDAAEDMTAALVVDFRQIVTLPVMWSETHAEGLGERWRLKPPYLEDFSQALGSYFARVALPTPIPEFTKEDFKPTQD
jgi:hypothetical protein